MPLHQPYPWFYPDATLVIVNLECDEDALEASLPDGFDLVKPARVFAWSLKCVGIGGVGTYHEFMINTTAECDGTKVTTTPFIYVDNDAAMASGREVLGIDKRLAQIDSAYDNDQLIVRTQRSGIEFATFGMTLDREGSDSDRAGFEKRLSVPTVNKFGDKVIEGGMSCDVRRVVHGRGFIDTRPSAADQLYRLKPVATSAVMIRGDFTLLEPRIRSAATSD